MKSKLITRTMCRLLGGCGCLIDRNLLAVAFAAMALKGSSEVILTTLHSFGSPPNGADPSASMVLGSDGNFYGTTYYGGINDNGTVFKISTNGSFASLFPFHGTDGANPKTGLIQGSDGNFYGTTTGGGTNNAGTVFKISAIGTFTSLYSFSGGIDGNNPNGTLVQGNDGNFYGTTQGGGTNNAGAVFKISANGTFTSLYSFTGGTDGKNPRGTLVQSSDGNFYGTTSYGGSNSLGTVFKINSSGALTSLYSFTGGNDGANPLTGLIQGSDGNYYGTTYNGGANSVGGTAFKISTNGVLITVCSFGSFGGPYYPVGLIQGSDGNFYGTTLEGGVNDNGGTVFKISSSGTLTTLYSFFGGYGGAGPNAGLVQGSDGYFYGMTSSYFTSDNLGSVFKISAGGTLTTLYYFPVSNDGAYPNAVLVQGSDGNFYGTTGSVNDSGTVFKISANEMFTNLYSFTGGNDGAWPDAGLIRGGDGYFYGTSRIGGTNNYGTVFKISSGGIFTSLYSFSGTSDGEYPNALVQGSDGYYYGTTTGGGTNGGNGTVFKISASGTLTSLYSFTGGNNGASPNAGLIQGSDGYFYGTTYGTPYSGTVFKISTNGAFTNLHTFTDGSNPDGALLQGTDGYFYGAAPSSFSGNNPGTVFRISASGTFTNLYSFSGGTDGKSPNGGLVQGSDGNFYGTTQSGGTNGYGTVFKISASGMFTSLYSFAGGSNGASPDAALVQGSDGNFYSSTSGGGTRGNGTVFSISVGLTPSLPTIQINNDGFGTQSNQFGFTISWISNASVVVQACTNLSNPVWIPLATNPIVDGTNYFSDPQWTNYPTRFYRITTP